MGEDESLEYVKVDGCILVSQNGWYLNSLDGKYTPEYSYTSASFNVESACVMTLEVGYGSEFSSNVFSAVLEFKTCENENACNFGAFQDCDIPNETRTMYLSENDCRSESQTKNCVDNKEIWIPNNYHSSSCLERREKYKYDESNGSCSGEIQTRTNGGDWSGTYTLNQCSREMYASSFVSSPDECQKGSQVFHATWYNDIMTGSWSNDYSFFTCEQFQSCGSYKHGEVVQRDGYTSVNGVCKSEVEESTCTDGVLEWQYDATCVETRVMYESEFAPCVSEEQTRTFGVGDVSWSGTFTKTTCESDCVFSKLAAKGLTKASIRSGSNFKRRGRERIREYEECAVPQSISNNRVKSFKDARLSMNKNRDDFTEKMSARIGSRDVFLSVSPENSNENDDCDGAKLNCGMVDVDDEGVTVLSANEATGSWTVLESSGVPLTKQVVSENGFEMYCWNNAWVNQVSAEEDDLYFCNGKTISIGSQASVCDCAIPCEEIDGALTCNDCSNPSSCGYVEGSLTENGCFTAEEGYCCDGSLLDRCGVCGGSDECVCGNSTACNYNEIGECFFVGEEICDCDGTPFDACGVCGGTNECLCYEEEACNYLSVGDCKSEDECGVCGGSGPVDGCCNGEVKDECGVCGGSGPVDGCCNGEVKDECGVCGGSGPVDGCCNGEVEDSCGVCGGSGPVDGCCNGEVKDACGVCGGSGPDECGVCGGSGPLEGECCPGVDKDECGVCGGSGPVDGCCNGEVKDSCGVCGGSGPVDGCCNGEVKDACGVCGGSNDCVCDEETACNNGANALCEYAGEGECCPGVDKDACGECGGGVQEGECCNGEVKDACGVCGGDGSTCGCVGVDKVTYQNNGCCKC